MQKARTESETCGHASGVANTVPNLPQFCFVRLVHFDICQKAKIITAANTCQVISKVANERIAISERLCILGISEQLNTVLLEKRLLCRQRTALLVFTGQFASLDFAGFDVGLIECVDTDDRTRYGGGDLPAE